MKSKTTRIENRRLSKDRFFRRLVTVFGLLVLAIFTTLILHIFGNAAPLLQSPNVEFNYALDKQYSQNTIGDFHFQGKWMSVDTEHCSLIIIDLQANAVIQKQTSNTLVPNCESQSVRLLNGQSVYVATISKNNLFALHQLTVDRRFELKHSFHLPANFNKSLAQNWQVVVNQNYIFITQKKANNIVAIKAPINGLHAPVEYTFIDAEQIVPLLDYQQFISIGPKQMLMYSNELTVLQRIPLMQSPSIAKMSASHLNLFLVANSESQSATEKTKGKVLANHLLTFTLSNHDGRFLLTPNFSMPFPAAFGGGEVYVEFDLQNNAAFLIDSGGDGLLLNVVTGKVEAKFVFPPNILALTYANSQLMLRYADRNERYQVNNFQGMASSDILLGKNTYAGYAKPEYIWQTSAATDSQSPKYSVVPLMMGSIKAAILALVVALPLALGAAIYTAYFAPSALRNRIKPSIEMLEAIPSVIIGFIAAVWLAPFAERYLLSIFSVILLLPVVVILIGAMHTGLQNKFGHRRWLQWELGVNAFLFIAAILLIFWLSLVMSIGPNSHDPHALSQWASNLTLSKTAVVVSLALGVAIAPTLFTLIDDALFEVPDGVKLASFALGATQIQTLFRVVLVVASPSIISAVMLGFGRAFGETMIVLMVTGNTPIANWDLLSGLRTLSSNLAIELPEAQVDSTLYHVLFLTAAMLFAFTFVINTIAAIIKRGMHTNGDH